MATEPKQPRKARFALNHDNYEQAHEGYTFGESWNGWDCPYFTRGSADAIAREQEGLSYDAKRDAYVLDLEALGMGYPDGDSVETFEAERIPDVDAPVYGIGRRSWCWEEVSPPVERER